MLETYFPSLILKLHCIIFACRLPSKCSLIIMSPKGLSQLLQVAASGADFFYDHS